jgi:hypothetical protein
MVSSPPLNHTHIHTHTHTHTLSLSLSLTHSLTHTHTLSLSLFHTITLSHSLSRSLFLSPLSPSPKHPAQDGKVIPTSVKEGDKVLLPDFGGNKLTFENKEYFLYRDSDVLGIFH